MLTDTREEAEAKEGPHNDQEEYEEVRDPVGIVLLACHTVLALGRDGAGARFFLVDRSDLSHGGTRVDGLGTGSGGDEPNGQHQAEADDCGYASAHEASPFERANGW
ncbi:MAG TPA: hypothetical protein VK694_00140 [Verrucomicrobiae bacterium]|nr:hypothetical protein [Verrucomicrobiae bacterium]